MNFRQPCLYSTTKKRYEANTSYLVKPISHICPFNIGCFSSCRTAHIPEKQETAISGNVLIVFYDAETGKSDLLSAAKKYGSRIIYSYKNFNGIAITLPSDKGVEESIRYYQRVKGVLSAG